MKRAAVVFVGAIWAAGATGCSGESGPAATQVPPAPHPGPAPVRRLTRTEYNNTIADLLGDTTNPADGFAAEPAVFGFDNNITVQVTSPAGAEDYLTAAEGIADRALLKLNQIAPCLPGAPVDEEGCARDFIARFGLRAYRRPLTPTEVASFVAQFSQTRASGDYALGIRMVMARMLLSPFFLYRGESGGAAQLQTGGARRLTPWETASRLSYLLWGSMPDEQLFAAAQANLLRTPEQIAVQAKRMLASPRAHAAVARFHAQWLEVMKVEAAQKNATGFLDVRSFMKEETARFLDDAFWQGSGSVEGLFTADHSFMNPELAMYLRIPGAESMVPGFQRVMLNLAQRIGVLTHASLLAVHAKPNESSPVLRGKFVLERLFCMEIPPPPPNVPPTAPMPRKSTRQRYAEHDAAPCATCHRLMDPVGFAFENFDAVGRWRDSDNTQAIDASGSLVGTDVDGGFANAVELSRKIATSTQMRRCLATQWFRFAAGRSEDPGDDTARARHFQAFESGRFDMRELLLGLTQSIEFGYLPAAAL